MVPENVEHAHQSTRPIFVPYSETPFAVFGHFPEEADEVEKYYVLNAPFSPPLFVGLRGLTRPWGRCRARGETKKMCKPKRCLRHLRYRKIIESGFGPQFSHPFAVLGLKI